MVGLLLRTALACDHIGCLLSVQSAVVSGTVWLKFAMPVLTVGCEPPVRGKGGGRGLEMGPICGDQMTPTTHSIATITDTHNLL